jgi:hydrogenase maturation protease
MNTATCHVLVIGYGHSLRGDDGVGQVVAQTLRSQLDEAGPPTETTIIWAEQLVPEMALDLAQATLAVFVDAACDGQPAGTVTVKRVDPATVAGSPGRPGKIGVSCWEDLTPAGLLALCGDLYGPVPIAHLITVSVDAPKVGAGLSSPVEAAVPVAVAAAGSAISAPCSLCAPAGARPDA